MKLFTAIAAAVVLCGSLITTVTPASAQTYYYGDNGYNSRTDYTGRSGLFGNGGYNYRTTDSNGNSWNTTCQPSGLFGNANMVCR